ncbi:MAG: polyprenyl synthetase family protein [Candidatus Aminicenantes bacterium]|nr:polyprenyl synthetase family protein [Candidatus Aminicenantes bacterium]
MNKSFEKSVKQFLQPKFKSMPSLTELYSTIKKDLNAVENDLKMFAKSANPIIADISSYLFKNEGKRIRPALLILCAKLLRYQGAEHIRMSALVETIHTASLLHDDIIDNSDLRRGQETVHTKWGKNITVLLGDYLYIKTLGLALESRNQEIVRILTDTSTEMIDGELKEYYYSGNLELDEEDYLKILKKKTASLFNASCLIGGILAEGIKEDIEKLAEYGHNIGMAFQIIDDLLDYTGDQKELGKPILSDLIEGRVTLPLIHTLKRSSPSEKEYISGLIESIKNDSSARDKLLKLIVSNDALDYTVNKANDYSSRSKEIISQFPESIYRDILMLVPDFLLQRRT